MTDPFAEPSENDDEAIDQAPICASCGVTMLPADAFGSGFSCQNDDCPALDDI